MESRAVIAALIASAREWPVSRRSVLPWEGALQRPARRANLQGRAGRRRKIRNDLPPVDWVLQPNTHYFHASGVLPLFDTDASRAIIRTTETSPVRRTSSFFSHMWTGLEHLPSVDPAS